MKRVITINYSIAKTLKRHLFRNRKEQGAFLFSEVVEMPDELKLVAVDIYLVSDDGWEMQEEYFLEMKDAEKAKIMKIARDGNFAVIDCHSHPGSNTNVWFSPSDCRGIEEFASYARWKLTGKPFTALVWGEASFDGVIWHGDFEKPHLINSLHIIGKKTTMLFPQNTWNKKSYWKKLTRGDCYDRRSL